MIIHPSIQYLSKGIVMLGEMGAYIYANLYHTYHSFVWTLWLIVSMHNIYVDTIFFFFFFFGACTYSAGAYISEKVKKIIYSNIYDMILIYTHIWPWWGNGRPQRMMPWISSHLQRTWKVQVIVVHSRPAHLLLTLACVLQTLEAWSQDPGLRMNFVSLRIPRYQLGLWDHQSFMRNGNCQLIIDN